MCEECVCMRNVCVCVCRFLTVFVFLPFVLFNPSRLAFLFFFIFFVVFFLFYSFLPFLLHTYIPTFPPSASYLLIPFHSILTPFFLRYPQFTRLTPCVSPTSFVAAAVSDRVGLLSWVTSLVSSLGEFWAAILSLLVSSALFWWMGLGRWGGEGRVG